jgi:hypothetical protein
MASPSTRPDYGGDGPNYAALAGIVELTDDPTGAFHQEMYDLHMGGATPPPSRAQNERSRASSPAASISRHSRAAKAQRITAGSGGSALLLAPGPQKRHWTRRAPMLAT